MKKVKRSKRRTEVSKPIWNEKKKCWKIPLTQGKFALVDDRDLYKIKRYNWCAVKDHKTWYAARAARQSDFIDGYKEKQLIKMHRVILNLKINNPMETDHRDGNGLNNRRKNIRKATHAENQQNKRASETNTVGYKGVYFDKGKKMYRARIMIENKRVSIGFFPTAKQAGRAYAKAARILHENFAKW